MEEVIRAIFERHEVQYTEQPADEEPRRASSISEKQTPPTKAQKETQVTRIRVRFGGPGSQTTCSVGLLTSQLSAYHVKAT
jgi:hypothetical protein